MKKGNIVIEKTVNTSAKKLSRQNSAEYYKTVADRVRMLALLEQPENQKGVVKLEFALSREGALINEASVVETSNPALNPFAIKAIKLASPFPPFPKALDKDNEVFKISLSYE